MADDAPYPNCICETSAVMEQLRGAVVGRLEDLNGVLSLFWYHLVAVSGCHVLPVKYYYAKYYYAKYYYATLASRPVPWVLLLYYFNPRGSL
jgi:hypothetical protein